MKYKFFEKHHGDINFDWNMANENDWPIINHKS